MSVYDQEAFEERVNYAASCIVKGTISGRSFDTCFEMYDGDQVAAALVRRTLKNPNSQLAAKLFTAINREVVMQSYEKTKHLSRKELVQAARVARETKVFA